MKQPEYYLYGKIPVVFLPQADGGLKVRAYHSSFQADGSYWAEIKYDRDNLAQRISEYEFIKAVLQRGGMRDEIDAIQA